MIVKQVYFEDTTFGKAIATWAESKGLEAIKLDAKESNLSLVDGLVVFHENHDLKKAQQDYITNFEGRQKGISKIDINGTLSVAASGFDLWLDRNRCASILVVGADELIKNPNQERFLAEIKIV